MFARITRAVGLAWLVASALTASPSGAATVLEGWRAQPARVVLVSPDSAVRLEWANELLGGLPTRVLDPAGYAQKESVQRDEQVVLLVRSDALDRWSGDFLRKHARDPQKVAADEVVIAAHGRHAGDWFETMIVAPDDQSLQAALESLLASNWDSLRRAGRPQVLANYKLVDACGIGTDSPVLERWLARQQPGPQLRYRPRVSSPANPDPAALRASPLIVTTLTYQQWRELGPAQEVLGPLLPGAALDALKAGNDRQLVTAVGKDRGRTLVGVIAPSERFFEVLLPTVRRLVPKGHPVAAAQLPDLSCPGGACTLDDWRGFRSVVLIASVINHEHDVAATELAVSLRRSLGGTGWQFIDDAALVASVQRAVQEGAFGADKKVQTPGTTLLLVARVHRVEARTDYAEGAPLLRTADPGAFSDAEPGKPDADERDWLGLGKKKYPNGANDPKYQEALKRWQQEHDTWVQKRDQYAATRANADVAWDTPLKTTYTVRLDGSLEIYGREGALLCTVPINHVSSRQEERPYRVTVRGHGNPPPHLSLPLPTTAVPAAMLSEAVTTAADETAQTLVRQALLPRDGGGMVAAGGTNGPGGTVSGAGPATAGAAPVGTVVTVTGTGPLANGEDAAFRAARDDALRQAVEQGLGCYVEAKTRVEKYRLIEDRILTHSSGFARIKREVGRNRAEDVLRVTFEVELLNKPLREEIIAMGLARQWRVMIVVPERHLNADVPEPAAENALMRQFIQARLPVIDRAQSEDLRRNRELLLGVAGNVELARKLRAKYNAEILVTGDAFSQEVNAIAGQPAARGRLTVKAVDLNTAEVLAADDQQATGTDQSGEMAGKAALRRCADEVSDRFIDLIYRRPMPSAGMARVELTLTGFKGFAQADRFKKALAAIAGVQSIRQLEFAHGQLKLEVELTQAFAEGLPVALETDPKMAEFKIGVETVTTGTVGGVVRAE